MSLWSPHPLGPRALAGLGTVGSWAVALEMPPLPLQPYYRRPRFEGTGKGQRVSPDISPSQHRPQLAAGWVFFYNERRGKER